MVENIINTKVIWYGFKFTSLAEKLWAVSLDESVKCVPQK